MTNYFKIAWRSIAKRKFYSVINIAGLAIAMACCILIYLYTSYHLSFDNYHKNANSIFRLVYELHLDKTEYDKGSSVAIFKAAQTEISQVAKAAISISKQHYIIDLPGKTKKRFKEADILFVEPGWFNLFQFNWLEGSPEKLDDPNTAALTQKVAEKYFGRSNPIGKTLLIKGQLVEVIGLIADSPFNTDLKADFYLSFSTLKVLDSGFDSKFYTDWTYLSSVNNVFVSLRNSSQKNEVEKQLALMNKKKLGAGSKYYTFKLLPLSETHFDLRYGGTVQKSLLITLSITGLLILLMAGINYINMVISQQARRNIEIGTRKVLGASAKQLFTQFAAESILTFGIAVVLATLLVFLTIPAANAYLFAASPVHISSYKYLGLFYVGMFLLLITISGIYPSLLLSRINVMKALKNKVWDMPVGLNRNMLIVLQNSVAQVLIVSTIIIVMQVKFLKGTDKGFDRKSVVIIPVGGTVVLKKHLLTKSLNAFPEVKSFSFCHRSPSSDSQRGATVQFNNRKNWEIWPARFAIGDSAYCRTFGMQIYAGRNIRTNHVTPEFLINETMASMLRTKTVNDILGKELSTGEIKGIIVGIVKDFNVRSLQDPIEPTVLLETAYLQTNLAIKLSGRNTAAALNAIEKEYLRIFPDQVFSYQFVDDQIAELYRKEVLQQRLIWIAACMAILISSLGLLGLISLITLQRTKEIGIRKILGASVAGISVMLSKDFLKMAIIAVVIAFPVSWWLMHQWLQNFAYRIEIKWWVFVLAGLVAILIALLTVSIQVIKAAVANPIKCLRTE